MVNPLPPKKGKLSKDIFDDLIRVKRILDAYSLEEKSSLDPSAQRRLLKANLTFVQIAGQIEHTLEKLARETHQSYPSGELSSPENASEEVTSSLQECIQDVIYSMRHELPLNKVTVLKIIPNDLPRILIEPEHLYTVISQLIYRAKHCLAQDTGVITIEAEKKVFKSSENRYPAQVCIRISDSGYGIPESELPHIFDPSFSSFDHDVHSGYRLYLVKKLTELYSGSIRVSTSQDGTSFYLAFFANVA